MATTPTALATIVADCRRMVDMKVSQFWTDSDFVTEINKSLAQLDMILVSKFNDYKLTSTTVSPTIIGTGGSSPNVIALPADFLKLRGLDVIYQPGNADGYIKCQPFNFKKRNIKMYPILQGNTVAPPYEIVYRLQGSGIYLLPASTAANYSYRLWYVPDFVPLDLVSNTTMASYMDSQAWYQYAVYDVAAKCQQAQDLDSSSFRSQKEELKEMIIKLSTPNRDLGEPAFITDERGSWGAGGGYGWNM